MSLLALLESFISIDYDVLVVIIMIVWVQVVTVNIDVGDYVYLHLRMRSDWVGVFVKLGFWYDLIILLTNLLLVYAVTWFHRRFKVGTVSLIVICGREWRI